MRQKTSKTGRKTKPKGPHPHNALTPTFCHEAAPGRHCDGNGLYLVTAPSGTRRWEQRIVIRGASRTLGLGGHPLISLAQARKKALRNRRIARSGGDPRTTRRAPRVPTKRPRIPTFREAANKVIAMHSTAWTSPLTRTHWKTALRDYVHPHIGDKSVARVTTGDIMALLLPIWTLKHATARKVHQRIATIMKWAIAQGIRADNPAGDAIIAALPKRPIEVVHMPALPYDEVPTALQTIRAAPASWPAAQLAFEFLVLTAARSGEVRLATWSEVDIATSTWSIPATRMKARRNHRVPLSSAALDVLQDAKRLLHRQSPILIFPGARGKPLINAISALLKDRAISAVPHGFRSSFRDWAAEQTVHRREVVEAALAHRVRDQTEAAYARSDLFDRRRQLMRDWADYLYRANTGRIPIDILQSSAVPR